MDSLTQVALGAAIGVAVMGRRTAMWKAALWGGVCGTLPDLDAFISYGDPISDMTLHRGNTHALFYLALASPAIAWLISRIQREPGLFGRWWLAVALVLLTHPLLDLMTVYGTQLARPFSDHPYAIGSIFIIDPLYTLPLLVGVVAALRLRNPRGLRWNAAGLALSTLYLAWGLGAQQHVTGVARAALQQQGVVVERLLVIPTTFNSVLWRIVAITPDGYVEGFRSLFDADDDIRFDAFARGEALYEGLRGAPHVERMAWFTHGFFKMEARGDEVVITDLRMGQEPFYVFNFVVARRASEPVPIATPRAVREVPPLGPAARWLWQRMWGQDLPPPR